MDRGTAAYFEKMIVNRRDAILERIWDRFDETGDPDPSDGERDQLKALDAALGRLRMGTYGRCESCDLGVEHETLEAEPETPQCADCATGQQPWIMPRRRAA